MKFSDALQLIRLLGSRPEDALTPRQVVTRWHDAYGHTLTLRTAQRYLAVLSSDESGSLLSVDKSNKEWRYSLKLSELAQLVTDEETAVYQLLSLQILRQSFGAPTELGITINSGVTNQAAREKRRTKRLRESLRIVPDGIGRLAAKIDQDMIRDVIDAIGSSQVLQIEYESSRGVSVNEDVTPLGLVAKDGTLYLVSVKSFSDRPQARPLHRFKVLRVRPRPALMRTDFNLDDFIRDSHQMSHPLDGHAEVCLLVLDVHPKSVYHFTERPIAKDQKIHRPKCSNSWIRLEVKIPITLLLIPFLCSFGPAIRVLEPPLVVEQMSDWIRKTAKLYGPS
jgi:predicted DNA-binding transcriptional regulator YafY